MNDGGYGGSAGRDDDELFGADPYPEPPVISAPPPPPRQETNTFATLSVVFAFVFAPVGAVLGHLGLSQIRRTGQRGHDRALIGLTLSYAFIVIAIVAVVVWAVVRTGPGPSSTVASPPARCDEFRRTGRAARQGRPVAAAVAEHRRGQAGGQRARSCQGRGGVRPER